MNRISTSLRNSVLLKATQSAANERRNPDGYPQIRHRRGIHAVVSQELKSSSRSQRLMQAIHAGKRHNFTG